MATDPILSIHLEHLSTTQSVGELAENKLPFLDNTELSLDCFHHRMQQTLTSIPSPASSITEKADGDGETLQTNNTLFILALLATVAGSLLMVFTSF